MLAPPPQPSILLAEAEDGPGIVVTIVPPPHGVGHDRTFDSYLAGRAYARLLWMEFGWRLVDRCDNKTKLMAAKNG